MTLKEYLKLVQGKPFKWGVNDCYKFVANWIDICYPSNNLPKFEYNTKLEASQINQKFSWAIEIKKHFNFEMVNSPSDGDLLILKENWQCAYLVFDSKIWSVYLGASLAGVPLFACEGAAYCRLKGVK